MKQEQLYQKAYKAYCRFCERRNAVIDEPSESDSTIGRKYVTLRNSFRELAKYEIKTGNIVE